jgi:hypothetical protein
MVEVDGPEKLDVDDLTLFVLLIGEPRLELLAFSAPHDQVSISELNCDRLLVLVLAPMPFKAVDKVHHFEFELLLGREHLLLAPFYDFDVARNAHVRLLLRCTLLCLIRGQRHCDV